MPEPDPIAELLAQAWTHCACGWRSPLARSAVGDYVAHLAEAHAAALRDAGYVAAFTETEWAAVDADRVIHIPGATCPADVLAEAHGHGAIRVGVARRTVIRTPWQPINHRQENP
jgi:hypothetical protein